MDIETSEVNVRGETMFEHLRVITIHGSVNGKEPLQLWHGKARFSPQRVNLQFTQRPGQPWRIDRVIVGGESVRKDGSIGERNYENSYDTAYDDPKLWIGEVPPEWLAALAEEHLQRLNREMSSW